jgi:transcriptional regulator with XRE-family HTH domain
MPNQTRTNLERPLGDMLRAYRFRHDLTVRDLAPDLGISIATLSRIERGHGLDATTLLRLISWMLEGSNR